jgi:hypothetical protein
MAMTRRVWVVTVRDISESSQEPAGKETYAFTMKLIERPAADTARSRFKPVGSATPSHAPPCGL